MRVLGPGHTGYAAPAQAVRRSAGGGGFSVSEQDAAGNVPLATSTRALTSLEALIELQAFEDPRERRRRAVKRGRGALDALDALKIGVLSGSLDSEALARLKALAGDLEQASGDPGLDAILAEISLRAAVELAKFDAGKPGADRR
jgi:hypothetical protein